MKYATGKVAVEHMRKCVTVIFKRLQSASHIQDAPAKAAPYNMEQIACTDTALISVPKSDIAAGTAEWNAPSPIISDITIVITVLIASPIGAPMRLRLMISLYLKFSAQFHQLLPRACL